MSWLALDIGGANIKVADGVGYAESTPFPLWKRSGDLAEEIRRHLQSGPAAERLAVTMTGELADCFSTKTEGVAAILDGVEQAAGGRDVGVYLTEGRIVPVPVARNDALLAAASNWHALASFAARYGESQTAVLVDCGSTTVDVIPIVASSPAALGRTDPERLVSGELVYTGVTRSPVCAVVSHLPWRGERCPVAQELFATTDDAYLLLGETPEEAQNTDTADGRPRTKAAAHARLARMVCADPTEISREESLCMAREIHEAQLRQLKVAYRQVVSRMTTAPHIVVMSGQGEFLLHGLLDEVGFRGRRVSLSSKLGTTISRAATAHALAVLAREGMPA